MTSTSTITIALDELHSLCEAYLRMKGDLKGSPGSDGVLGPCDSTLQACVADGQTLTEDNNKALLRGLKRAVADGMRGEINAKMLYLICRKFPRDSGYVRAAVMKLLTKVCSTETPLPSPLPTYART